MSISSVGFGKVWRNGSIAGLCGWAGARDVLGSRLEEVDEVAVEGAWLLSARERSCSVELLRLVNVDDIVMIVRVIAAVEDSEDAWSWNEGRFE
jgi:hypothetical protein